MLWEEALFLWPDLKELQKLKKLSPAFRWAEELRPIVYATGVYSLWHYRL